MSNQLIQNITTSDWVAKYKPINCNPDNPQGAFELFAGAMLDTDEESLAKVKASDPLNVWTLIDNGDEQFLKNGVHFADRMGYIITEVPYAETDGIILVEDEVQIESAPAPAPGA
jgi:hypothetical protein